MQIGQKTLSTKNTRTVTFYRGQELITITVGPLPPKYMERLRAKVLVRPEPPKKPVETKPGIYLREGNKVVFSEDDNDPLYVEAASRFYSMVVTAKLTAYLSYDPNVQFSAAKPSAGYDEDPAAWRAYFEQVYLEITDPDTGFTNAEVSHLMEAGDSTELKVDIEESTKTF